DSFVVASCNADDRVINAVLCIASKLSNRQRSLNVVGIRGSCAFGDCSVHFLLHNLGKAEDWQEVAQVRWCACVSSRMRVDRRIRSEACEYTSCRGEVDSRV